MVHFKKHSKATPMTYTSSTCRWGSKGTERPWKTSGDMCRNGQTGERFIQIQIPLKMMGSKRCHEICVPHALCCRGDLHFRHADLAHSRSLCKSVVQAILSGCLAFKVPFFMFDVSDFGMQPPPFRFRKSCHGKKEMITPFTAISVLTSKIAVYSLQNDGFFAASKTCECYNCPTEPAERVNGIGGPSPPCCKQQGWQGIKANSINVEYICWTGCAWSSKVLSSVESSFLRSSSMTHLQQPTSKWQMMPIVPVASVPSETWDTRVQGSWSWTIQKRRNWVSWVPS